MENAEREDLEAPIAVRFFRGQCDCNFVVSCKEASQPKEDENAKGLRNTSMQRKTQKKKRFAEEKS